MDQGYNTCILCGANTFQHDEICLHCCRHGCRHNEMKDRKALSPHFMFPEDTPEAEMADSEVEDRWYNSPPPGTHLVNGRPILE